VGVNRVGRGGRLDYPGDSMILDPLGRVLSAAAEVEGVVSAVVDPAVVAEVRQDFPFLQDRR
jgi:predicted amidohydrolase